MIPHFISKCKLCGIKEYMAWHPFWTTKQICYKHRDKLVNTHKSIMDRLLEKSHTQLKSILKED